jgi:WD40 repeat protein
MAKIFVSYSRKDKTIAGRIVEALEKNELEAWIDWEDIPPTADWLQQIHKGIEEADAFLFLLSPDSIASQVCGQEVDHAVQNGKRLIPIVLRDVNSNSANPALAKVNWIFCRESDDFNGAVEKTLFAIRTDLEWVEAHSRLQIRAVEWEKRAERSLLLRGRDLREAEEKLASAGQKDPLPTDLQRRYVLESRRWESRTRSIVLAVGALVMLALALISVFAVNQRNLANDNALTAVANQHAAETSEARAVSEADARATAQAATEREAKISQSRAIAALSTKYREMSPQLSMLFAVKAFQTANTYEARNSLLTVLQTSPPKSLCRTDAADCLLKDKKSFQGDAIAIDFSPDRKLLAVGGCKTTEGGRCSEAEIIVWDYETWETVGRLNPDNGYVWVVAFSPDSSLLAVGTDNGTILWDFHNGKTFALGDASFNMVLALAFSPDGSKLASAGNSLAVWDVETGGNVAEISREEVPIAYGAAFNPQGNILAFSGCAAFEDICHDGKIAFFDAENYQPLGEPITGQPSEVMGITFTQGGGKLIATNRDGLVTVWDVETHAPFGLPLKESSEISVFNLSSIAFSPDGNLLGVSSDKNITLIDTSGRQPLGLPIKSPDSRVKGISFNSDGTTLASVDHYGVKLWNLDPAYWVELVCTSARRNFSRAEWITFFPDEPYQKTCPQWAEGR